MSHRMREIVTGMTKEKIAIIGTGAIGSIHAMMMSRAGHEVWAIDQWSDHVAAINKNGLRVEGPSGDHTVTDLHASTRLADAGPCDLYLIVTKASGVGPAAEAIAAQAPRDALIVTIQNGLGAKENIARHLPTENVLLGIAEGFGASIKAPGHGHYTAMRQIRLGELNGGLSGRLLRLRDIWRSAGFNANAFEDIQQLVWEKFLCNVALSGPCTVFGCGPAELRANPVWWDISLNCVREAYACGLAEGVNFSFDDPIAYVTDFASGVKNAFPSMLQDHLARRRSEIDAINGMVPVVGTRHGIETPYNHTLSTIIRAHEAAFSGGRS